MRDYTVKALSSDTWDAFARFAERHNGVFGGCWCTYFHTFHAEKTFSAEGNRALKQRIYHRKEYEAELDRPPDYRITCIFVDKKYRRKGLTAVAPAWCPRPDLAGRLQLRTAQGTEELRDAQGDPLIQPRPTVTSTHRHVDPLSSRSGTGDRRGDER